MNSEKLARKIGVTKCLCSDQTCHIEKENKFNMVCDHVHLSSGRLWYSCIFPVDIRIAQIFLETVCLIRAYVQNLLMHFNEANFRLASQKGLIKYQ